MKLISRFLKRIKYLIKKIDNLSAKRIALIIYLIVLGAHFIFAATHNTFLQDSARDILLAEKNIASHDYIVNYGPKASVGNFYLPPFYYQLQLLLVLFLPSYPLAMRWLIVIIESTTPVLLFYLFILYLPKRKSMLLALLYAVFHQVLVYSTQSWNPNMIPFFTTAFLVSWLYFFEKQNKLYIYLSMLALGISFQLHYQTFVLLPFAVIIWFYTLIKYKKFWIDLLAAPMLATVPFWPYIKSEFISSFTNTRAIQFFFSNEHSLYFDRVSKPEYVFSYFPKFLERLMFSRPTNRELVGRMLFFGGFVAGMLSFKSNPVVRWLFLYFGSIFIMLRLFKGDKLDYYLMMIFILPIVLMSWLALKSNFLAIGATATIIFLIIINVRLLPPHNYYQDLQSVVEYIEKQTDSNDVQVIFHELSQANYFYFGFKKFSNLEMSHASNNVVDICSIADSSCSFNNIYMCMKGRSENSQIFWYALKPKWHNNYQITSSKNFDNHFVVVVGSVDQPTELDIHPQLHDQQRYGSDIMFLP